MTFQTATSLQYRHATYYEVVLDIPGKPPEPIGHTQRKSGTGLMVMLQKREDVKAKLRPIAGIDEAPFRKRADRLEFGKLAVIRFSGDTMRQAAN